MISSFQSFFITRVSGSVSAESLAFFRVLFGLLSLISSLRFLILGWVDYQYSTVFQFKYAGFGWVAHPGTDVIWLLYVLMCIASVGIVLGAFYRGSAALFFVCFTWVELIDLTYYLNHYYLVSLLALLLIFLPAHRSFSVDAWRKGWPRDVQVPAWCLLLLRFQVGVVYFLAGIAKINTEWLFRAMPMSIWLPARTDTPLIGPLLDERWVAFAASWAVVFFDITVVFWLLWKPSHRFAYAGVLLFHILSGYWFQIGVFPLLMSGLALVFFPASWHRKVIWFVEKKIDSLFFSMKNKIISVSKEEKNTGFLAKFSLPNALVYALLSIWIATQLFIPFRYLFYPGNLFWTEAGFRYSWRVMLVEKAGEAQFYVRDAQTGREGLVRNADFLNEHQIKQMSFQPDLILQFAHFLEKHFQEAGMAKPEIRAQVYVTWNGRTGQLLFDEHLILNRLSSRLPPHQWLNPAPL